MHIFAKQLSTVECGYLWKIFTHLPLYTLPVVGAAVPDEDVKSRLGEGMFEI